MVQINLGSETNPKPIFVSESLSPSEKEDLIHLIQEYTYVFAWNCEDIPGLDPQMAMHCLNISLDIKQVKQQQRRFRSEITKATESEIRKLINSDFVREEQHPNWVANIFLISYKNRKIQICIDD